MGGLLKAAPQEEYSGRMGIHLVLIGNIGKSLYRNPVFVRIFDTHVELTERLWKFHSPKCSQVGVPTPAESSLRSSTCG